jgi:hypothetical protein
MQIMFNRETASYRNGGAVTLDSQGCKPLVGISAVPDSLGHNFQGFAPPAIEYHRSAIQDHKTAIQ